MLIPCLLVVLSLLGGVALQPIDPDHWMDPRELMGRALTRPIDIETLDIEVSPSIRAEKLQSSNFLFGPEFLEDKEKNELDGNLGNEEYVPPVFSNVVEDGQLVADLIDKIKDVVEEAETQESPLEEEGSADGELDEVVMVTTQRSKNPWDYIDRKEIDSSNRGGGLYLVYQCCHEGQYQ